MTREDEIRDDEIRFCSKCGWNDSNYGCTSPPYEEVYQCPMYMYYHPEEVEKFNKAAEEWIKESEGKEGVKDEPSNYRPYKK